MPRSTLVRVVKGPLTRVARLALSVTWRVAGTRVVLTSVPKCGTHLLQHLLDVVGVRCGGEVFVNNENTAAVLDFLLAATRGRVLICHLQGLTTNHDICLRRRAKVLFISRDPRDQVVSHVFHFRTHVDHPLHLYFRDRFPELDQALHAAIRGFGPGPDGHLADVDTFFRYFLAWRDMPGVYATTFERLVGPHGGGSAKLQAAEVTGVLRHIGFPLSTPTAVGYIANRVFSTASPTFRIGQIGGWRQYFKPDHVDAFKEVAGRLLIDLGYERDLDW